MMSTNNKNAGCRSFAKGGCGCLVFVVFGFITIGTFADPGAVTLPYFLCTLAGLAVCLWGIWEGSQWIGSEKRYEQEYAKLLAEFKQDAMNEAVYEKIVLFLNHGKKQGTLNVATAPPEEIFRFYEVLTIRYYAILARLHRADSPALRSELLNVGRLLNELNSNKEWSEKRLANDLATLSPAGINVGSSVNVAAQLAELGELCKNGVITQAEFERGKALFLGNPPDIAAKTLDVLDGLHKLKMNGALSESEYNIKKWELLGGKNLNPK